MPQFPADFRMLAIDALDQVVAESSELAELWGEAANCPKPSEDIARVRHVLNPPIPP